LQRQSIVSIHVCDEIGNLIETVLNNKILSGKNSVVFENPLLTNGIYIVKFTTGTRIINKKLVVLK
jgi:hypothetical protein